MAPRSKITRLPAAVKEWVAKCIIDGEFSGYELISDELKALGHDISRSAVHRFGQDLERQMSAIKTSTEACKLLADAAPDDADLRSAAIISMVQTNVFNILVKMQEIEDADPMDRMRLMGVVGKMVAELTRASVVNKKHQEATRIKATAVADAVDAICKKAGVSFEGMNAIRVNILGIAS